jgi:glycosyltransferase involved in cell wall biosynthesis
MSTDPKPPANIPGKVLMLGPHLSNMGGVASVEQIYFRVWDHRRYHLKHIATFVNAPKLVKLFVALWALVQCLWQLLFWRPDLVHIHFSWAASFYRKSLFAMLVRVMGPKLILHCHAPDFEVFYERQGKLGQRYIRFILGLSDRLLVIAEQWRLFFEGLSLDVPILTLYNPVSYPQSISRPDDERRQVVLFLGRLGQRKGTYDILQAIPLVLEDCPETEFWFGGDGDVEQVREIASAQPWAEHVHLLGWVRGEDKEKALARASMLLLPSRHEGLGMALLEAMAHGLPVLGTEVGGIPEVVIDGETGFLIHPGDVEAMAQRITSLLEDRDLQARMGAAARQRILDTFEASAVIRQLFAVYDSLESRQ